MACKWRPLYSNLVVKLIKPGETAGGLIIPESVEEENAKALVIAVGEGAVAQDGSFVPPVVHVGDQVLLNGKGIVLDSKEQIFLVPERSITCILLEPGIN